MNARHEPLPATMEQAAGRMLEIVTGSWAAQIVRTFAELGIADLLAEQPAGLDALGARLGVAADALRRLLRAGVALGLLVRDPQQRYAATPLLACLRTGVEGSMRGLVMALGMPGHWLPWGRLPEAIRSGERQTLGTLDGELWDHYARTPAEAATFSTAMGALAALIAAEAKALIPTEGCRLAVDVGGASGALVMALMQANEALHGCVLDLPQALADASSLAKRHGLEPRFEAVAGDFFEAVPPADLYLVKHILHDWDDAACVRILRNCAAGLAPGGRVAIIELDLQEGAGQADTPAFAAMMDLTMLVLTPGRERTLPEYEALLAQAGLRIGRVARFSPATSMLLIEAGRA